MKNIRFAAAAAVAVVAGAVAMGGPASAGPLSAARPTAHAAPAMPANGTTARVAAATLAKSGAWGKARPVPGLVALNRGATQR